MTQEKVIYNTSQWTAIFFCPSHNFARDIFGLATPLLYGACSFKKIPAVITNYRVAIIRLTGKGGSVQRENHFVFTVEVIIIAIASLHLWQSLSGIWAKETDDE